MLLGASRTQSILLQSILHPEHPAPEHPAAEYPNPEHCAPEHPTLEHLSGARLGGEGQSLVPGTWERWWVTRLGVALWDHPHCSQAMGTGLWPPLMAITSSWRDGGQGSPAVFPLCAGCSSSI